ncbi:hypothetical protein [Herbaspirillum huttiense]|nr:hypothetical protein [Herbaspirillum huttiense]UWE14465.1 hypothetical protein NY669_15205 [Herbaspirillum huttiense]
MDEIALPDWPEKIWMPALSRTANPLRPGIKTMIVGKDTRSCFS